MIWYGSRPRLVLLSKSYCRDINIHRCRWQKILNTVEYGNANSMLKTFTCKSHHQSVTRSPHLSLCFSSGVMWWWMDAFNPVSCRCSFSFPTTPSWTSVSFFNFQTATGKNRWQGFRPSSLLKSALCVCHKAAHQNACLPRLGFSQPLYLFSLWDRQLARNSEDLSSTFCATAFSSELKYNALLSSKTNLDIPAKAALQS